MFDKIKEKIIEFLGGNSSHDLDHTMRVHDMCMYIGKQEWADLEILKISSLLHDIGRPKQFETKGKICHAEYGSILAKDILEELGLDSNKIDQVIHCISTHRFRKGKTPESLEAKILFDSDKLDSIGAIGIGRAFMYASEVGAKVHNNESVDILETQEHTPEDTAYREYMFKLRNVKARLFTETAHNLAEKRNQVMKDFFDNLNDEVWGIKQL